MLTDAEKKVIFSNKLFYDYNNEAWYDSNLVSHLFKYSITFILPPQLHFFPW